MIIMKMLKLPEKNFLHECFSIVENNLIWKTRPKSHFNSQRSWAMWNAKFAGEIAGRKMYMSNYRQVGVSGVRYLEHRIIAKMLGIESEERIDHIDGDGLNNKIENLRTVTQSQNGMNNIGWGRKPLRVGVYIKNNGKFTASCTVDGSQKHLGTFETYKEAVSARVAAENKYYGKFSVTNSRVIQE